MSNNQFYGGLNKRFDNRAALLRRFHFTYRMLAPGIAVFSRNRYGREQNIAAATLLHADRRVWVDTLRTVLA